MSPGDTDAGVRLVEGLDDLVTEIVNDLYLADYGQQTEDPPLGYQEALTMARTVVGDPCAQLRPEHPEAGTDAAARLEFATKVRGGTGPSQAPAGHPALRRPVEPARESP